MSLECGNDGQGRAITLRVYLPEINGHPEGFEPSDEQEDLQPEEDDEEDESFFPLIESFPPPARAIFHYWMVYADDLQVGDAVLREEKAPWKLAVIESRFDSDLTDQSVILAVVFRLVKYAFFTCGFQEVRMDAEKYDLAGRILIERAGFHVTECHRPSSWGMASTEYWEGRLANPQLPLPFP